jgi:ribosome modulation factor
MDAKDIPLPEGYSKQTGGAWRKGYAAYVNGKSKIACPYGYNMMRNTSKFNVYRSAWLAGWEKAKDESDNCR